MQSPRKVLPRAWRQKPGWPRPFDLGPCRKRSWGAVWPGILVAVLVLVAGLVALIAYQNVKKASQPQPVVMTDAAWQEKLVELQERFNAVSRETGVSIGPLIKEIRELAEQSDLKGPGYLLLGQAVLATGNFPDAYDAFKTSLEYDTGNAYLERLTGSAAFEIGEFDPTFLDKAVVHFERGLELKPDDAELRLFLAESLIQRNQNDDRERALLLLTEALQLDNTLHAAHYRLSGYRLKNNNAESALEAIRKALEGVDAYGDEEERETYWRYQAQHAKILMRLRDYTTALRLLLEHPERDQEPLLDQIAACHAQLGHPERAAAAYELLTIDQPIPPAHLLERGAHWWLKAQNPSQAQPLIEMYRAHPEADPLLVESLLRRLDEQTNGN